MFLIILKAIEIRIIWRFVNNKLLCNNLFKLMVEFLRIIFDLVGLMGI